MPGCRQKLKWAVCSEMIPWRVACQSRVCRIVIRNVYSGQRWTSWFVSYAYVRRYRGGGSSRNHRLRISVEICAVDRVWLPQARVLVILPTYLETATASTVDFDPMAPPAAIYRYWPINRLDMSPCVKLGFSRSGNCDSSVSGWD
jgi:hypothetical protein